jgi:hypothetical protein
LLKLDRHHPAFFLTCDIEYFKYVSMCMHVSRFDFGKADVDKMILPLAVVDWLYKCVQKFYELFTKALNLMFQNTS